MLDIEAKNQQIQWLLGLGPEDLAANHNGNVSRQQADRIHRQRMVLWRGLATLYVIPLVLPLVLSLLFSDNVVYLLSAVFAISWTIGFTRAALLLRTRQLEVSADVDANNVQSVEGKLWQDIRNQNNYTIGVQNQVFSVQKALYDILQDDEIVALYYLGNSRKLLAIEYLQGPFIEENMTL